METKTDTTKDDKKPADTTVDSKAADKAEEAKPSDLSAKASAKEDSNKKNAPVKSSAPTQSRGGDRDSRGPKRRNRRQRKGRARPEFDHKIIDIRRVSRVVTGGRRFSFSVAVVAGDHKGQVGVGLGKAGDTALAIDKGVNNAKKNMVKVPLTETGSIAHDVSAKYSAVQLELSPAPGRGVLAGSSVRDVLKLAGIKDVRGKLFSRTKNGLNNARATIKALSMLEPAPKTNNKTEE